MTYDNSHEFTQSEGELVTEVSDSNSLMLLNRGEIDMQIATAKRYPRSIKSFRDECLAMVTLTEEIAGECIYALPRDGKTIEGPSARFAEVILSAWGNARAGARVVSEEGDFVTAQGAFYDLQRNVAITYEVKRRIVDKNGRRFKPDMIGVTANAACSVSLRNAILKGIPKAFWNEMYQKARQTVRGDFKTLANRRASAIEQFQGYGVTPDMIYRTLGVQGKEDITLDHLVTLKGILTAIQEGETTPEQAFAPPTTTSDRAKTATEEKAAALLAKHQQKQGEPNPPQASELPQTPALTTEEAEQAIRNMASQPARPPRQRGRGSRSDEADQQSVTTSLTGIFGNREPGEEG